MYMYIVVNISITECMVLICFLFSKQMEDVIAHIRKLHKTLEPGKTSGCFGINYADEQTRLDYLLKVLIPEVLYVLFNSLGQWSHKLMSWVYYPLYSSVPSYPRNCLIVCFVM